MSVEQRDPRAKAASVLGYLRRFKNDRGAMADLRCVLSPAKMSRAWPLLAPIGGIGNPRIETVAGLYAYHPDEAKAGNMGTTCRTLQAGHNSFEGRFRRLLACDRDEICERLRPIILAAKAKGVGINYEELLVDLYRWGTNVKAKWAREYWRAAEGERPGLLTGSEVEG